MTSTLPPNTFEGARSFGSLGYIDPDTHRFVTLFVKGTLTHASPFDTAYYKFYAYPDLFSVHVNYYESPGGSSFLQLYDANRNDIADNRANDETFTQLTYSQTEDSTDTLFYLQVVPSPSSWTTASYSIAIAMFPLIPEDLGGDAPGNGTHLGTLSADNWQIFGSDSFYTLYDRQSSASMSHGQQLTVLGTKQVSDDRDFFHFTVQDAGTMTLQMGGTTGGYILHGPPQGNIDSPMKMIVANGAQIHVVPGEYYFEIVDSATITAGANISLRNDWEVYESYNFSLSLKPDNPFGAGDDWVDLTTPGLNWYAGTGNDHVNGTPDVDGVYGESGDDSLQGGSGNDVLGGGPGDDYLYGGAGDDVLFGDGGWDWLSGGEGNDVIYASDGMDDIVIDTPLGPGNVDTVYGFDRGDDSIWLAKSIFTSLKTGSLSKKCFIKGKGPKDKNDFIIYNKKTGSIYYDADGRGSNFDAVEFLKIGKVKLKSADFYVFDW